MGITQHEHGVDNVRAIVNLGLARGNVGRPGAGLMPIRGHSGVQGGAEMGVLRHGVPGRRRDRRGERGRALGEQSGFPVADAPGPHRGRRWSRPRGRGELDVLWSSGGNFLDVLPDPDVVARRARRACRCACTRTSS